MKLSPQTLERFFAGVTEYVFQAQFGVADPQLLDYMSGLLARFVRLEAIHKVRDLSGRPMTEVAEMMMEANERVGSARREVHRHIGDFTLFWAGVYPEALRSMQNPLRKDHFIDYCAQGKKAYLIASTIETEDEKEGPSAEVLERLSHEFELCAYGLREVRREWERRDDDDTIRPVLLD